MKTQSYNLQHLLGQGGMAKVYIAEHKTLGHKVAIKVLNMEFVHNENIRKRFLAEARNLAKMNHPHVVRVMDLIEEGEMVAFVMEYIEGQTLRDYLDQKGKLPNDEIKKLFGQMLEAVGYVHEQGLVHRDIKPSNFMLDSLGNIKLLDFGIAKIMDASSAEYTQTATSIHMGTPMYMSPEQVNNTKEVTAQSDIYSLGVVLWQMAAGSKPYDTNTLSTFEIQTKIVNEPLPKTFTVWDEVIEKATAKDLKNTFKSIQNGKLVGSKSQVISKPKAKETEKTVIPTNWGPQDKVRPTPVGWDKESKKTSKFWIFERSFWKWMSYPIIVVFGVYFYLLNPGLFPWFSEEKLAKKQSNSSSSIDSTSDVKDSSISLSTKPPQIESDPEPVKIKDNTTKRNGNEGSGVSDIEGNKYKTVIIGNQEWMAENLKTTKRKNGADIQREWDADKWFKKQESAYFILENDQQNYLKFGCLYNGYCIESQDLCPIEWHVPSEKEWGILIQTLGGKKNAGGKLKQIGFKNWQKPNQTISSDLDFNALPGGHVASFGDEFGSQKGVTGLWWTSTISDFGSFSTVHMFHDSRSIYINANERNQGFSVRCIKN